MNNPQASQGHWASVASEPNNWQSLSDVPFEHVAGIFLGGRTGQEDSVGLLGPSASGSESVFVVCDGMGGERGGARASGTVRDAILRGYASERSRLSPDQALKRGIEEGHRLIQAAGVAEPEFSSMGTTVVALATNGRTVWHAHCGDSRIYELEQGTLKRRTKDHTRVQRMIDENLIPVEVAEKLPDAHVLSHAVGRGDLRVDCGMFDVEDRARRTFMLCSDGLHGVLSDSILEKVMAGFSAAAGVRIMMELIRALNGSDNTSVVMIRFGAPVGAGNERAIYQQAADEAAQAITVTMTTGESCTLRPRAAAAPVVARPVTERSPAVAPKKTISKLNIALAGGLLAIAALALYKWMGDDPAKEPATIASDTDAEGSGSADDAQKAQIGERAGEAVASAERQSCEQALDRCSTARMQCDEAAKARLDLDAQDDALSKEIDRLPKGAKKTELTAQRTALRGATKDDRDLARSGSYDRFVEARSAVRLECAEIRGVSSESCLRIDPASKCEAGRGAGAEESGDGSTRAQPTTDSLPKRVLTPVRPSAPVPGPALPPQPPAGKPAAAPTPAVTAQPPAGTPAPAPTAAVPPPPAAAPAPVEAPPTGDTAP